MNPFIERTLINTIDQLKEKTIRGELTFKQLEEQVFNFCMETVKENKVTQKEFETFMHDYNNTHSNQTNDTK